MKIRSAQQANAATCCGCARPVCADPRKQTYDICGYVIGADDELEMHFGYFYQTSGTPDAAVAGTYGTVTLTKTARLVIESDSYEGEGWVFEGLQVGTFTKSVGEGGSCDYGSPVYTCAFESAYTMAYEDEPTGDYLVSYSSSGSCSTLSVCSGTETYTYAISGDDTNMTGGTDIDIGAQISSSWTGTVWTSLHVAGSLVIAYSDFKSHPYRFGIPAGYTRSVWEMEWDEVAATTDWWAWYDGGMVGTEPTPGPTLAAHRTWTWAGDPDEPWSPIYDPDGIDYPGEVRPVNVLVTCYHSTRLGNIPTAYGPEVALP